MKGSALMLMSAQIEHMPALREMLRGQIIPFPKHVRLRGTAGKSVTGSPIELAHYRLERYPSQILTEFEKTEILTVGTAIKVQPCSLVQIKKTMEENGLVVTAAFEKELLDKFPAIKKTDEEAVKASWVIIGLHAAKNLPAQLQDLCKLLVLEATTGVIQESKMKTMKAYLLETNQQDIALFQASGFSLSSEQPNDLEAGWVEYQKVLSE